MKLFFETLSEERHGTMGREWNSFLQRISPESGQYKLTKSPREADIIIGGAINSLDQSNIFGLIRPLTRGDIFRFVWDWSDRPAGRSSGFYCALPSNLTDSRRHHCISYPIAFNELVTLFPPDDAHLNYGFLGGISTTFRARMVERLKPLEARTNSSISVQQHDWQNPYNRQPSQHKTDFINHLRTTKFILCPRGYGVGSARLFETMKAGRVPVIISDKYVLPSDVDWQACSLRVKQSEIDSIPGLIENNIDRWHLMASAARAEWESNFSDAGILSYIGRRSEQTLNKGPAITYLESIAFSISRSRALFEERARPLAGAAKRRLKRNLGFQF